MIGRLRAAMIAASIATARALARSTLIRLPQPKFQVRATSPGMVASSTQRIIALVSRGAWPWGEDGRVEVMSGALRGVGRRLRRVGERLQLALGVLLLQARFFGPRPQFVELFAVGAFGFCRGEPGLCRPGAVTGCLKGSLQLGTLLL